MTSVNFDLNELPNWIQIILKHFNSEGITWCFLREPYIVKQDIDEGKELDLWVDKTHLGKILLMLSKAGWNLTSGSCIDPSILNNFSATLRFQLQQKREIHSIIPRIEIHIGSLKWRSLPYLHESEVKKSIHHIKELAFIEGAALLSILSDRMLLRGNFEGDRLTRAQIYRKTLSQTEYKKWRTRVEILFGKNIAALTENCLLGTRIPSRTILLYAAIWVNARYLISHRYRMVKKLSNLWRRVIFFRTASTICLVGTDGSGKSTTIENLLLNLNQTSPSQPIAMSIYWGRARGNTRILGFLRTLFNKKTASTMNNKHQRYANNSKHTHRSITSYLTIAAAFSYIIDYWIRYFTQIFPYITKYKFILIDRGPLDISLMPGNTTLFKKISHFGPRFYLYVLCDASTKTIRNRKDERTAQEIIHHQRTLHDLIMLSKRGVTLNTEQNIEYSINTLKIILYTARALHKGKLDMPLYNYITKEIDILQQTQAPQ